MLGGSVLGQALRVVARSRHDDQLSAQVLVLRLQLISFGRDLAVAASRYEWQSHRIQLLGLEAARDN